MNHSTFKELPTYNNAPMSLSGVSSIAEHTVEPELLGVRPRSVQWATGTIATRRLLWNLMAGFLFLLIFFARNDIATWDALIRQGVVTEGRVYEKYETHGKNTSYHLLYTVPTDAGVSTGNSSVSYTEYAATEEGSPVTATYLPGTNGEKWQKGYATQIRRNDRLGDWILGGVLGMVVFGIGLSAYEYNIRRQKALLQSGLATVGQITGSKVQTYKNSKTYTLEYQFPTERFGGQRSSATVSEAIYNQYSVGNPRVTVLYEEFNPDNSKPYFQLTAIRLLGQ